MFGPVALKESNRNTSEIKVASHGAIVGSDALVEFALEVRSLKREMVVTNRRENIIFLEKFRRNALLLNMNTLMVKAVATTGCSLRSSRACGSVIYFNARLKSY